MKKLQIASPQASRWQRSGDHRGGVEAGGTKVQVGDAAAASPSPTGHTTPSTLDATKDAKIRHPNLTAHQGRQESTAGSSPATSRRTTPRGEKLTSTKEEHAAATTLETAPHLHLILLFTRQPGGSRVPPPSRRRSDERRGGEPQSPAAENEETLVASLFASSGTVERGKKSECDTVRIPVEGRQASYTTDKVLVVISVIHP